METQEIICRLCLKICDSFRALEENMKNLLDTFLLKINLAVVQKPVVCANCVEILEKCFDFKAMCKNVCESIVTFVNDEDVIKLDPLDVPLSRNEKDNGVPEDQGICTFCRSRESNCSAVTRRVGKGDVLLKKMIKQCLPELNLSIIKKPSICESCRGSLEVYFHFITNCLMVEEKIKKYCETLNVNSTDQIELSSLLQFTIRIVTKIEVDRNLVDIIKIEELCEEIENTDEKVIGIGCDIKLEHMSNDDSDDAKVGIEHETESYMEMTDLKFNNEEQFTQKNMLTCKEESDSLDEVKMEQTVCEEIEIKKENLVEMKDQKFLLNEEIEIKTDDTDFSRFEDGVVSPYAKVVTEATTYKCDSCSFQTKYKNNLKIHLLVHQNPSEVTMYKCPSCSFWSKRKGGLKNHLLVHKDPSEVTVYKCDFCSFQTKLKWHLKNHLLVHKDPSEVTVYKCDFCSFQTKRKWLLKKHLLVHNDSSEVTMYKCASCSFRSKWKGGLRNHLLEHKNPSEVTMYKCGSCSFQTKHKSYLKRHLLGHKDLSEVTVYHCDSCLYQTKHKRCLRKHALRLHKDPSEITIYKCDSCSYQTTFKDNLIRHLLVHKIPSEVTVHKCDSCSFQTKRAICLKRHLLMHMDPSEITMYKCASCSFQTKRKSYLKNHSLVHQIPSEVTVYKCDSCSFQTKRAASLKRHLLVHMDPSEITMYKCASCSFQSKRKGLLKNHLLVNKGSSKVKMYKCESCSFQTKLAACLKGHLLVHKDPSEITM